MSPAPSFPDQAELPCYVFSLLTILICSDTSQSLPLDCQLPEGRTVVGPASDTASGMSQGPNMCICGILRT